MLKFSSLAALLLFIAVPAQAHDFAAEGGFVTGLSHPVLGLDHLLAMLSVGIVSIQIGGRAIYFIPLTFVLVMLVGGILGMSEIALPFIELGIILSVCLLGLVIAADRSINIIISSTFISVFALFHGHAHGTEMPYIANPWIYSFGFVIGTAVIHVIGVSIGYLAMRSKKGLQLLRFSGATILGFGLNILFNSYSIYT